jgi:hypothetical protein
MTCNTHCCCSLLLLFGEWDVGVRYLLKKKGGDLTPTTSDCLLLAFYHIPQWKDLFFVVAFLPLYTPRMCFLSLVLRRVIRFILT